jgi:hypothetical protein
MLELGVTVYGNLQYGHHIQVSTGNALKNPTLNPTKLKEGLNGRRGVSRGVLVTPYLSIRGALLVEN